jgi:hypothetical protein
MSAFEPKPSLARRRFGGATQEPGEHVAPNSNLIAHRCCGTSALMNSSVCIARYMTMARFGWVVEDVVR